MRADEFPIDLLLFQLDDYNIFDDSQDPFKVKEGLDNPSSPEDATLKVGQKSPHSGHASPRAPTSLSTSPATSSTKQKIPRHKRQSHINAEHRRRCKIQTGFEELQTLVPAISESKTSGRESKSGMLYKTVDFCRKLRQENKVLNKETEALRAEIQALTAEISHYQQNLPETGIAVTKPSNPKQLDKMFKDYVQSRTFQNWKFWIFGMFIQPLWETFKAAVSVNNMDEFSRSTMVWLQQHCSLIQLRPAMMNLLLQLSTKTSVMSKPERLPEEAMQRTMEAAGFSDATSLASSPVEGAAAAPPLSVSPSAIDVEMANLQIRKFSIPNVTATTTNNVQNVTKSVS